MSEITDRNFGILIAYLLPGFVALTALAEYSEPVRAWLGTAAGTGPTVGGFLYVTLASVAAGLTVSALRWLILDTIHHHAGVPRPQWDFAALPANLPAFQGAVENHYRYYQFYGNALIALLLALPGPLTRAFPANVGLATAAVLGLSALFFVASRDALRKYYTRTSAFLQVSQHRRIEPMTNGWHPTKKNEPKTTEQTRAKPNGRVRPKRAVRDTPSVTQKRQSL